VQNWFKKWRIKINENKACSATFTLCKSTTPNLIINDAQIPYKPEIKYLGMTLDSKLTRKKHIIQKRKQVNITFKQLNWILGRNSQLNVENKLLIYKTIIIPIWTYGLELWGCASKSNVSIIQRSQSKILRSIVNAPWYVSNATLHTDLGIQYVQDSLN
jgi:hypothetical protein